MNPPLGGANAIWSGYVEGGGRGVKSPWPLSAPRCGAFSVTLKGPERACAADIKVHTGPVIVSATLGFGFRSGWGRHLDAGPCPQAFAPCPSQLRPAVKHDGFRPIAAGRMVAR